MGDLFKRRGVNIEAELARQMGGDLLPGTLIKANFGNRSDVPSEGKEPGPRSYQFRGFLENIKLREVEGSLVQAGDRQVTILGGTLPPGVTGETQDQISIEGGTFTIVGLIERDPDGATFIYQVR